MEVEGWRWRMEVEDGEEDGRGEMDVRGRWNTARR